MGILDIAVIIFASIVLIGFLIFSIYMIWRFKIQILIALGAIIGIGAICYVIYLIGKFIVSIPQSDDITALGIFLFLIVIIGIIWSRKNSKW